jgi:16S rRNA (guanine1516-N2)-methyltransferase
LADSIQNTFGTTSGFVVTTSHRPSARLIEGAQDLAAHFKVPFAARRDLSLKDLAQLSYAEGLLVVSARRTSFLWGEQEFFFHPGLARPRIKNIRCGNTDRMIKVMSLRAGESVLDCTMGPGADIIVASYVSGAAGRVTGIESSPVMSELVRRGLLVYEDDDRDISEAMRRVNVVNKNHKEYLASLKTGCYDIVYFDPMFRFPRRMSSAINTARMLANHDPIDCETIELALNVAGRAVVMKERRGSSEFSRLGFENIVGGNYASVAYGIMER